MNKPPPKTLVIGIAACLLGVVLALVGAEFPADTSFIQAVPFWLTVVCTAALLLTIVSKAISYLLDHAKIAPTLKTSVIGVTTTLLVTLPLALMCLPIDDLLPDQDRMVTAPSTTDPMAALYWAWADQYLNLLPAIAGFWLFIKALDLAFPDVAEMPGRHSSAQAQDNNRSKEAAAPISPLKAQKPSALERRFPEISGLALLAIEADEHYVRLHTESGSRHVLYRFRDALRDVEDVAGLRVHRSWWVAEDAMETFEQYASGFGLRLKGGLKAPVSQTYRRDVERAIEARSKPG